MHVSGLSIAENKDLKAERFISQFQSVFHSFHCFGPEMRQSSMADGLVNQSHSPCGSQEAGRGERQRGRGPGRIYPSPQLPVTTSSVRLRFLISQSS